MEGFWLAVILILYSFHLATPFILPLKKNNGSLDVEHLVGHMTLLEQTITGFQQTIRKQDIMITALTTEMSNLKASQQTVASHSSDISSLKTEISNLKANQQTIASHDTDISSLKTDISNLKTSQQVIVNHHVDIATLKTEISNLKSNHQMLNARISDLEKQAQSSLITAEVTSLKAEVNTGKTELTLVSNEVASLSSKLNNLTQECHSQMKSDQNTTKTLRDVQGTLGRVLTHIHSADNDRFLLHNHVNMLKTTILEQSKNSTSTIVELSTKIAQLKTEVRFDAGMGSSNIDVQASSYTTLKFSDIRCNIGGGYNATTGVFTAPVSGTYLFWSTVDKTRGSSLSLHVKKGNDDIGEFYTSTVGDVSGSLTTAADVKTGEEVYVSVKGADNINYGHYSNFGGLLVNVH